MALIHRPNVISAKRSGTLTVGEYVREYVSTHRKGSRTPRYMVQDLCDICLCYAYIRRSQLSLRNQGRKFMCEICWQDEAKAKLGKENHYMPCWQNLVTLGKTKKK